MTWLLENMHARVTTWDNIKLINFKESKKQIYNITKEILEVKMRSISWHLETEQVKSLKNRITKVTKLNRKKSSKLWNPYSKNYKITLDELILKYINCILFDY